MTDADANNHMHDFGTSIPHAMGAAEQSLEIKPDVSRIRISPEDDRKGQPSHIRLGQREILAIIEHGLTVARDGETGAITTDNHIDIPMRTVGPSISIAEQSSADVARPKAASRR